MFGSQVQTNELVIWETEQVPPFIHGFEAHGDGGSTYSSQFLPPKGNPCGQIQ